MRNVLNFDIMANPLNWITVALMSAFFLFALREILRLFESGKTQTEAVTKPAK